jgi:hypothetical protein
LPVCFSLLCLLSLFHSSVLLSFIFMGPSVLLSTSWLLCALCLTCLHGVGVLSPAGQKNGHSAGLVPCHHPEATWCVNALITEALGHHIKTSEQGTNGSHL